MSRIREIYPATQSRWEHTTLGFIGDLVDSKESIKQRLMRLPRQAINEMQGKEVHEAFEVYFNQIQLSRDKVFSEYGDKPIPGDIIQNHIEDALNESRKRLKLKSSKSSEGFFKKTIAHIEKKYDLWNPNSKDIRLAAEFKASADVMNPSGVRQAGLIDLLVYKQEDDIVKWADIHDWKTIGDKAYTTSNDYKYLRNSFPTLGYHSAVSKMHKMDPSLVNLYYHFDNAAYTGNGEPVEILGSGFNNRDTARLMHQTSKIESIKQLLYEEGRTKGETGVKRLYREMIESGACATAACNVCPLRYQCKRSDVIVKAMVEGKDAATKYVRADSSIGNAEHAEILEQYNEKLRLEDEIIKDKARNRKGDFLKVDGDIHSELLDDAKAINRGFSEDFIEKVRNGAIKVSNKLQYGIDDDTFNAPWMNSKTRKVFKNILNTRVQELTTGIETRQTLAYIQETVSRKVVYDSGLLEDLTLTIADRAGKHLKASNLDPSDPAVSFHAMQEFDKTLKIEDINKIISRIDASTKQVMSEVAKDSIDRNRIGVPSIADTATSAIGPDAIKTSSDEYLEWIRQTGKHVGISDKMRMGRQKFPLPVVMAAATLGYISSAIGIHNSIQNKYDKVAQYMDQEPTVSTGEHMSFDTTLRRLTLSDFGSKVLPWGYSHLLSGLITKAKDFIGLKTISTMLDPRNVNSGLGDRINYSKLMDRLMDSVNPGVVAKTTVGSAVVMGFLPNIRTSDEIGEDVESRKKRFKEHREVAAHGDSNIQTKDSQLRHNLKAGSPFSSPYVAGTLGYIPRLSRLIQAFVPTQSVNISDIPTVLKRWNDGVGSLITGIRDKVLTRDIPISVPVTNNLDHKMKGILSRGYDKASFELAKSDRDVSSMGRGILRKNRSKAGIDLTKLSPEGKVLQQLDDIPVQSKPTKMPAIVKGPDRDRVSTYGVQRARYQSDILHNTYDPNIAQSAIVHNRNRLMEVIEELPSKMSQLNSTKYLSEGHLISKGKGNRVNILEGSTTFPPNSSYWDKLRVRLQDSVVGSFRMTPSKDLPTVITAPKRMDFNPTRMTGTSKVKDIHIYHPPVDMGKANTSKHIDISRRLMNPDYTKAGATFANSTKAQAGLYQGILS